jgi:hypothetical protein
MSQIFFEGKEFDGLSLGKIWTDGCRVIANINATIMVLAVYAFEDWAQLGGQYLLYKIGKRKQWI